MSSVQVGLSRILCFISLGGGRHDGLDNGLSVCLDGDLDIGLDGGLDVGLNVGCDVCLP